MTGYSGGAACCTAGVAVTGFDSLTTSLVAVTLVILGLLVLRLAMTRRRTRDLS